LVFGIKTAHLGWHTKSDVMNWLRASGDIGLTDLRKNAMSEDVDFN
jgi:hypothetical protein